MRADHQPSFCGIAIMAKASRAGLTKTRLSPPLSLEDAALCNTAFLRDVAENLLRAGSAASLAGYVAYGPAGTESFFRTHLPQEIGLLETWFPDFGLCLCRAIEAQLALGHQAACVLNSDSPTLPSAFLAEAASVLAAPGDRIVLGPSTDGGYYLLGCKRIHPRLFEDIAWSTEAVARQTLERAAELGLAVHMLPAWYDVDDAASLRMARREVLDGVGFHPRIASSPARNTAELFGRLGLDEDNARHLPPAPASFGDTVLSALTAR
jgi:uncharacterized protein